MNEYLKHIANKILPNKNKKLKYIIFKYYRKRSILRTDFFLLSTVYIIKILKNFYLPL